MNSDARAITLRSYAIDDDLAEAGRRAIEVTVILADERRRWCFFITPEALSVCGDWVEGTQVRLHLGEPHMIVVSEVSVDVIERVLRQLHATGELERRTLPLSGK